MTTTTLRLRNIMTKSEGGDRCVEGSARGGVDDGSFHWEKPHCQQKPSTKTPARFTNRVGPLWQGMKISNDCGNVAVRTLYELIAGHFNNTGAIVLDAEADCGGQLCVGFVVNQTCQVRSDDPASEPACEYDPAG